MKAMRLFGLVFLFLMVCVSAEQTVKTLELPIGYVASASANTDYVVPINIVSPDGIAQIISVELIVKGDFLSSSVLQGRVKGENDVLYSCNPISWTTPSVSTYGYEASFDCSDLVRQYDFKGGEISFGLRSSRNAKNVHANTRLTYLNRPELHVSFSGTEYILDEDGGKVFVQLLSDDRSGTINNATCFSTIYRPDGNLFLNNVSLTTHGSEGFYYYDLPTLTYEGVYMASVWCYVPELIENVSTSVIATDDFSGQICSGSGWGSRWQFAGDEVYHTLSDDPELITPREPDNFISIGGSFGSVYQDSASILMKDFPNTTVNLMRIDLYASIDNPNTKDYIYNVSICPTSVSGLTSNATLGADCVSPMNVLSTQNLSCSQGNVLQDFRDPIPFELNDDYVSGAYSEIVTLNYVSGDVSQSSFWTAESKGPPSPPSTNRYRRVLNTTSSFVFPSLMNIKFYLTQASFVDSATLSGLTIPHSCHSGDWCLYLNGTRNGYAERTFDSSGATSLNITGWTDFHDAGIYDVAKIEFLDGASWETIETWTWFDVHDWEYFEIILNDYDYDFGTDTILRFTLEGTKGHFMIDDLQIEKTGVVGYYEDNVTEYQLGRGSTEIHVTSYNYTAFSEDVWSYPNRVLTDYNQTEIFQRLMLIGTDTNYTSYEVGGLLNRTSWIAWKLSNLNAEILEINGTVYAVFGDVNELNETLYLEINEVDAEVWQYYNRTLTYYEPVDLNVTEIAEAVWDYLNRTLTEQATEIDYDVLAEYVWNETSRDLTDYNQTQIWLDFGELDSAITEILANQTIIYNKLGDIEADTNYTEYEVDGLLNRTTWIAWKLSKLNSEILEINSTLHDVNETIYWMNQTEEFEIDYDILAGYVWNDTARELTDYNLTEILQNQDDISDLIQALNNISASDVWDYSNRTLTYYETAELDYALMQLYIWNATNRDLTDYNQTLLYSEHDDTQALIQALNDVSVSEVWSYFNRTLTEYETTVIDYDVLAGYVWNETVRDLTDYNQTLMYQHLQELLANQTTLFDEINEVDSEVWNFSNRTLTYYENFTINTTEITEAVWNHYNRTLTEGLNPNITVNVTVNGTAIDSEQNATLYATLAQAQENKSILDSIVSKLQEILLAIEDIAPAGIIDIWEGLKIVNK